MKLYKFHLTSQVYRVENGLIQVGNDSRCWLLSIFTHKPHYVRYIEQSLGSAGQLRNLFCPRVCWGHDVERW